MKIKAKCSFAGKNFSASSGQVLDLPDETAKDLIQAGYAEGVKDETKRDTAGDDPKSAKGKRGSTKRS